MTYRSIANRLLRYIGVDSLQQALNANVNNQRGLAPGDIPDVVACIQAGIQEHYTLCPAAFIQRSQGAPLRPPAQISITVTQYSTACVMVGYASWMAGCTIRISGDEAENRIASSTELIRPFMGATGSQAATVYCDCVTVDPKFAEIIEPVDMANHPRLHVVSTEDEFTYYNRYHVITPKDAAWPQSYYTQTNKSIAEPCVCFGSSEALGTAQPAIYLRFNPMPGQAYVITYAAKLAPPVVTEDDIWDPNDPDTDPGTESFLPNSDSILLPFCLQRWTAHPSFSAEGDQLREIARQYETAKNIAKAHKPMRSVKRAIFLP